MAPKEQNEILMRQEFGMRLKNIRKMRGLSLAELGERLDGVVSSTAVDKYEKGAMYPQSTKILIALADALNVSLGDLMRPIKHKIELSGFSFRKKSKLGLKAQESILQSINLRIEKYLDIQDETNELIPYKNGKSENVVCNAEDARQSAMMLREIWRLGLAPISSPFLLMENHGVMVIEVCENPELFDGTSNTVDGIPVIVLNRSNKDEQNPDEERRRLTCFHEFAHQYLTFGDMVTEKQEEDLCNVFASEMLLPSVELKRILGDRRDSIYYKELKNIQQEYGISVRAIMIKARQLGIIVESYYKWFCIKLNKDNELKSYIDRNIITPQHTIRFEQLVLKALSQQVITASKAAEYLGISMAELSSTYNIA